jgi:putative hemolysin
MAVFPCLGNWVDWQRFLCTPYVQIPASHLKLECFFLWGLQTWVYWAMSNGSQYMLSASLAWRTSDEFKFKFIWKVVASQIHSAECWAAVVLSTWPSGPKHKAPTFRTFAAQLTCNGSSRSLASRGLAGQAARSSSNARQPDAAAAAPGQVPVPDSSYCAKRGGGRTPEPRGTAGAPAQCVPNSEVHPRFRETLAGLWGKSRTLVASEHLWFLKNSGWNAILFDLLSWCQKIKENCSVFHVFFTWCALLAAACGSGTSHLAYFGVELAYFW